MGAAKQWLGLVVIVAGAAGILGPGSREDRYSCNACRALKEVRSTKIFNWVVQRQELKSGTTGADHVHEWLLYSYSYSNGVLGCLGGGVACKTDGRFKNEQRAKSTVSTNLR